MVSAGVASSLNSWVLSSWIAASNLNDFEGDALPLLREVFIFFGGAGVFLEFTAFAFILSVAAVCGGITLAFGRGVLTLLVASVVGILYSFAGGALLIAFKVAAVLFAARVFLA